MISNYELNDIDEEDSRAILSSENGMSHSGERKSDSGVRKGQSRSLSAEKAITSSSKALKEPSEINLDEQERLLNWNEVSGQFSKESYTSK